MKTMKIESDEMSLSYYYYHYYNMNIMNTIIIHYVQYKITIHLNICAIYTIDLQQIHTLEHIKCNLN